MALELRERTAVLSEAVTVEEVEELVAWLRRTEHPQIDLRNCNHLHTAAFQAIMAFGPKLSATPVDSFLNSQLLPVLTPPRPTEREEHPNDDRDAG